MKIVNHLGGSEMNFSYMNDYVFFRGFWSSKQPLLSLIGNLISMIHQQALNIAQDQDQP